MLSASSVTVPPLPVEIVYVALVTELLLYPLA
jgi:hypothetical protein